MTSDHTPTMNDLKICNIMGDISFKGTELTAEETKVNDS